MPPPRHRPDASDYAAVVRAHHKDTVGFILADSDPCLHIQDLKVTRIRRTLRPIASSDLERLRLPRFWMLAVLLWPGDTTGSLASWASRLPAGQLDRVRFYLHPETDARSAAEGWARAGLPPLRYEVVRDFPSFHRLFGLHFNDRVYEDAAGGAARG